MGIRRARICFADISEDNPNVWYEVGYAVACGKPIVFAADKRKRKRLPFDTQHRRVILYDPLSPKAMASELQEEICSTLSAVLGRLATEGPTEQYEEISDVSGVRLEGEWIAHYVEDDLSTPPYVVRERVEIQQVAETVQGTYYCETYDRIPFVLEGRINRDSVLGTYYVPMRRPPDSSGSFQLKLGKNDEWLEGYCTWLDHGSGRVECSKSIWFRPQSQYATLLEDEVARIMDRELELFAQRHMPTT